MKPVPTLIKISKQNLDEVIINKQIILDAIISSELKIKQIRSQIEQESNSYTSSEFAIFLENFIFNAKNQIQKLNDQINSFERTIYILDGQISELYRELKSYQILLGKHKKAEMEKEKQLEMKILDELNILRH